MQRSFRLLATSGCGVVLLLGWGCSLIPNQSAPQDPFVMSAPGVAPQQRSRPSYAPPMPSYPDRTSPRNLFQPYASPPSIPSPSRGTPKPYVNPYYSPPPQDNRSQPSRSTPTPRETPRTFADPDRAPEPVIIPPRDDSEPQRTEKFPSEVSPVEDAPSVDGPQLMPLEETSSTVTTNMPESTADGRLELRVDVPQRRPVGGGAPFQLTIRNVSPQTIRNVSVRCEFDAALSFPGSDRKSVTHKIPRIDAGDAKDSSLTLISETAGRHECRFAVLIGSKVVFEKSVTVEFVSRQLDWHLHGPSERTVGSRAEFNIPLINVSGQELRDLKVRVNFDAALTVREMTQGGQLGDRSLTWDIDRLAANEGLLLQLEVECREPTTQACLQVTVSGIDLPEDQTEACLTVKSRAGSLEVRLHDVTDPIAIGDEAELVVTIQNEGLQSAKDVVAACTWPEGLTFVSATIEQAGRSEPVTAEVDGRTASFAPTQQLAPNQRVEYHVKLTGQAAGTHRVTVSVTNSSEPIVVNVTEPIMVHR